MVGIVIPIERMREARWLYGKRGFVALLAVYKLWPRDRKQLCDTVRRVRGQAESRVRACEYAISAGETRIDNVRKVFWPSTGNQNNYRSQLKCRQCSVRFQFVERPERSFDVHAVLLSASITVRVRQCSLLKTRRRCFSKESELLGHYRD